ncbi:tetratricopeptide repeat protein [Caniella muris]|uniref:tetratricopeptide repeat protein n=1 Tax=Caniella muris TaxID=2941502 RepID=UPI00203AB6B4|nr:hypothetical protein [Caniella muris]
MLTEHGSAVAPRGGSGFDADPFSVIPEQTIVYDNGDELPGIWLTEAVYDEGSRYLGRTYLSPYAPEGDFHGEDALWYGGGYYDEAMALRDPSQAAERQRLFQAVELLYRHGAGQGNAVAQMNLGYVYYYDRAAGAYWEGGSCFSGLDGPMPLKERAFCCFLQASDAGLAEASYKLGDCHKNGVGCEPDDGEAFRCYRLAMDQDGHGATYLSGSIALRLADCCEEGRGCGHDFARALEYCRLAETYLDAAVNRGSWYYKKALRGARDGILCCEQEIALGESACGPCAPRPLTAREAGR